MRRVCVFCGSNLGALPAYADAARVLGAALARRQTGLVYGGAGIGVMGALAEAVLASGGEVIGVMPRGLLDREAVNLRADLRVVETMHERKALMASLSDGFLALPGGMGTLDELCEVITWAQLDIHRKPIGLLDVAGYWTPFLAFLDHAVTQGFFAREHRELLQVGTEPAGLLAAMEAAPPVAVPKWKTRRGPGFSGSP